MTVKKLDYCPFCGSTDIDPEGVASFKPEYRNGDLDLTWDKDATPDKIEHRPACNDCNATTCGDWNTRAPVRIKPLEWIKGLNGALIAKTPHSPWYYKIERYKSEAYMLFVSNIHVGKYRTEEGAKKSAAAHYETVIQDFLK